MTVGGIQRCILSRRSHPIIIPIQRPYSMPFNWQFPIKNTRVTKQTSDKSPVQNILGRAYISTSISTVDLFIEIKNTDNKSRKENPFHHWPTYSLPFLKNTLSVFASSSSLRFCSFSKTLPPLEKEGNGCIAISSASSCSSIALCSFCWSWYCYSSIYFWVFECFLLHILP